MLFVFSLALMNDIQMLSKAPELVWAFICGAPSEDGPALPLMLTLTTLAFGGGIIVTGWHLWMLRREPRGWRVAGMAATPFPGEPPVLLDFENLEATIEKVNLLAEEIRRRDETAPREAQQPQNSQDSLRR